MKLILTAIRTTLLLTLITGIIYPLFVTVAAHLFFPWKSKGSFLEKQGSVVGSELIGQKFEGDRYFWSRPSAINYNPFPSGGSNLSLSNSKLKQAFEERKVELQKRHATDKKIPSSLLFASGSGVDPHISPYAAYYQAERIAKARHIDVEILYRLIDQNTERRFFGIFGMPRVNVLKLNLALDNKQPTER